MSTLVRFRHQHIGEDVLITNLQQLMRMKNVSEADLSRQTNIPQPTLHKILSGKTSDPRISTLRMIADYFCITLDSLYSQKIFYPKKLGPEGKFIPLLSWEACVSAPNFCTEGIPGAQQYWICLDKVKAENMFALISKPSMEPRFPRGTILIVSCDHPMSDGNFVIVHYTNTNEATIRQLYVDGPDRILLPINDKVASTDKLDQTTTILGTLIQSRFDYETIHGNIQI